MPIFKVKLLARKEVSENTFIFSFEKPEGFTFIPGQYAGFTLINPPETDDGGITRRFSLLSSPNDNVISFATRILHSAYKRVLKDLPIGSEIKLAGPTGQFILHDNPAVPAVFIAGGIGVTPFYTMIEHETALKSLRDMTLFYGNQSHHSAPFLNELNAMQKNNPRFRFIPTLEKPNPTWQGETGLINESLIRRNLANLDLPIFYICGSPAMVAALHQTLLHAGISEDKIKVEEFPGY